jgi:regulatory protein YycI of two-component signal transduction system YycFG
MNYIFHCLEECRYEVPRLKQLLHDFEQDPSSHPEINSELRSPRYLRAEIFEFESKMNRALKDKHTLLNSPNEVVARKAEEMVKEYYQLSDKQRTDRYVHGKTIHRPARPSSPFSS